MGHRIHVFGASGSGTTTLGRCLAERLDARFLDGDRYYWKPTDPPFQEKQPPQERVRRIEQDIEDAQDWVLAGSLCSWGDPLLHRFTVAVFLHLDHELRMQRIMEREHARYGERIGPGGDMYQAHREFVEWAASYDSARAPIRSLHLHETWMGRLRCPVLRIDSAAPVDVLCDRVLAGL